MPYFKNNKINLLFIHIPKTGGTSVEYYFSSKYNIKLNVKSLYSEYDKDSNIVSLQHRTLDYILSNKKQFRINLINTEIITIVRNPYNRIMSELFFLSFKYSKGYITEYFKIDFNTNKDDVYNILKYVFTRYAADSNIYDNHIRPQYEFLIDKQNNIDKKIKILKMEKLKESMHSLGYSDFMSNENRNENKGNYMSLLNKESIELINNFYHEDFIKFGYQKINY